uniref:Enkurin domain-containing protein n=1 Tax=Timema douglasi TaxID=61478 RepID=A0A7R8VB47_TIMDO|nr:unnamed protein product [Timema douglasi]
MSSIKDLIYKPEPTHRKNFIQENVRQIRRMQRYWNMKDKDGQGRAVSCKESLLRKVEPRAISSNTSDGFKVPVKASRPTSIAHSCGSLRSSASTKSGDRPKGDRESRDRHKSGEVSGSSADDERLIVAGDVAKLVRRQRAVVERELAQLSELDSCSETSSVSEKQGRFRESGSQTLSARSLEDLYRSGVVVRPSSPLNIREHPWVVENQIETPDCTVPTKDTFKDLNLSKLAPGTDKHLVANNFDSKGTSGKVSSKQKGTILDSLDLLKPPSSYQRGVVPKYLRDRQEQWQKALEAKLANIPDPLCPEGHVPLLDQERKATLNLLRNSYTEMVKELNMMPVRSDTLRARQRKIELESQLNKLEDGIKVFSRPRVFIKVGE